MKSSFWIRVRRTGQRRSLRDIHSTCMITSGTMILLLRETCRHLLVVTISGLPEGAYEGETAEYIRSMHWLNRQLLLAADEAVELRYGEPVKRKGGCNGIL